MTRIKIDLDELTEMYDEALNEQGVITIGALEYSPAHVLQEVDPIAYDVGLNDYYDLVSDEYECTELE